MILFGLFLFLLLVSSPTTSREKRVIDAMTMAIAPPKYSVSKGFSHITICFKKVITITTTAAEINFSFRSFRSLIFKPMGVADGLVFVHK